MLDSNAELGIVVAAPRSYAPPAEYIEATRPCSASLDDRGRRLGHGGGQPFPDSAWAKAVTPDSCHLSTDDPKYALKLAWNLSDRWQGPGTTATLFGASRRRVEGNKPTLAIGEYRRTYFSRRADLVATGGLLDPNDASIHWKERFTLREPFDLRGAFYFRFRYNESESGTDHIWIRIPELRRTRHMPRERTSESLFGSQIAPDDFFVFSGEILDYTWEIVGTSEILVPIGARDCFPGGGPLPPRGMPATAWKGTFDWAASAWEACRYAPHGVLPFGGAQRFEPREVVELLATPRDRRRKRRIIWVDRETSMPVYAAMSDDGGGPFTLVAAIYEFEPEQALLIPKAVSAFDRSKGLGSLAQFYGSTAEHVDLKAAQRYFDPRFGCIASGTPVWTTEGWIPVDDLAVGARMYAYDEQTDRIVLATLDAIRSRWTDQTIRIGPTLRLTPDHPVFVSGGWKAAGTLSAGSPLLSAGPQFADAPPIQRLEGAIRVFDLTRSRRHNFFAGGYLVHNKSR